MKRLDKARKVAIFIKAINNLLKHWDLYTQGNTGVFYGKVNYYMPNGPRLFSKPELIKLLEWNKKYLRELLK